MTNPATTYQPLGNFIQIVDHRNRDLQVTKLLGLSIDKCFIPSIANTIGTDMSTYKIIQPQQFAYGPVTSRNGDKITIALYTGDEPAIISQAYVVFEITGTYDTVETQNFASLQQKREQLLPEYLMMWFRRPEFDRYARYHSHGSAREIFDWDEMCATQIPVPPIAEQRAIVAEYAAVQHRMEVNKRLIAKLEETAQTLYKKMFVDGVDKENLPDGWRMGTLGEVCEYVTDKIDVEELDIDTYISAENMVKDKGGIIQCISFPEEGRCTKFQTTDVLLSNIRPYFKKLWKATFDGGCSNDVLCIRTKGLFTQSMLYYTMEGDNFFDYVMAGSNGVKMPRGDKNWIMNYEIVIPQKDAIAAFERQISAQSQLIENKRKENNKLTELQSLLLARMGK